MKSAARCNKAMEWHGQEQKSVQWRGYREALKELGCEGLARSRSELQWKSLDGEERQWNSVDQICVAKKKQWISFALHRVAKRRQR